MDDQRDVQTSMRNGNARSLIAAGSAVDMEIKRKKIRESTLFPQIQKTNLQDKLDFEIRMREGAYKLLLACSKREQVLSASKNLLTCSARIKAYSSELQAEPDTARRFSDERVPCTGTVAISGLRIPLMWKDCDHFNNRGSSRRVAVFCLVQMGAEVFDTAMVVVDRSVTDICFEGVTVFKDAVPHFELRVELWSCAVEDEPLTLVNTPKKLAKKLRNSFGKSAGRRLCPLLDTPDPDTFLQYNPIPAGAKYNLLAHATMRLPEAEGSFQSHSLIVLQDAEWSSWLPLYGNVCCRLVAQPSCMTHTTMEGYLNQKQSVEGMRRCCRLYCVLSAGCLRCFFSPEEVVAKVPPALSLAVNKDTRIRVMEKESSGQMSRSLSIVNPLSDDAQAVVFTAESREELEEWLEALHQHLYDQSEWRHCCDQLMAIEVASPQKPSLFLTKQADSVYNDLSINSPGKFESITDIIHNKIEETDGRFLIGRDEEREAPDWSALFGGSCSAAAVHKRSAPSRGKTPTPCASPGPGPLSSTPGSGKKRRAPPPPSNREPFVTPPPPRPARPPLPPHSLLHMPLPLPQEEKENSCSARPPPRSKTGRPSLDAKFSAIIQQLQRNNNNNMATAAGRKNAPLGVLDVQPPPEPHHSEAAAVAELGMTARSKLRKSFRERMNMKAL